MNAHALVLADAEVDAEYGDFRPPAPKHRDQFQSASADSSTDRGESDALAVVYPLNVLAGNRLAKTLVVSVERDTEGFIMSNGRLRVWGAGETLYEALSEFSGYFLSVLRSFNATPDAELTEDAIAYRDELRSYLA